LVLFILKPMSMKLFLHSFLIMLPVLGFSQPSSPEKAVDSLILVSRALTGKGEFDSALEVNAAAEKLALDNLGRESAGYGNCCNNHGRIFYFKGEYFETEKWWLEAKAIRAKALGKEHLDYARSLSNLGVLYSEIGDYEKSETFHLEAKGIWEKVQGKQHPDYARSLNNLGILYSTMGNYEKAEPLYLEAMAIQEKTVGKEHPDYAASLNSLGVLYRAMRNYEKAEPLFLEAKTIRENALGKEHPDLARSLNNLAVLYWAMGNFEKAEQFHLEAKAIREKALGKEHPDYAASLSNLGALYFDMGKYGMSEPFYLEAMAIREKTMGKEHPFYAMSLYNLADLYEVQNRFDESEPRLEEYYSLRQSMLSTAATFLSEQELASYTATFKSDGDNKSSYLYARMAKGEPPGILPEMCFDHSLFQKGFLLMAANRLNTLAAAVPETAQLNNQLKSYRRRLADELSNPIADRTGVAELEEKANTLEKELARKVAGYGEALRQVTWQEVQQQLKPGEAAIEFVHFRYFTPKPTDSTMYAALVIRPGDASPRFLPLFEERELAQLLKSASGRAFTRINALYALGGDKSLYDLIWKPMESQLEGVKTVYCSPSGLLHRLNLAATAPHFGAGGSRQLVALGSTRQLVLPDANPRSGTDAVLIGGVRYTSDTTAIAAANAGIATKDWPSSDLHFIPENATRGDDWKYLPESTVEVLNIQEVLQAANWAVKLDTGYFATEEAFRNIGHGNLSPRILHVATHGFFFPDPTDRNGGRGMREGEPMFKLSAHPMIRSGLLLAGAEEAWVSGKAPENREDGILTAYEISQMNLSNTELVVLSACETGMGDIEGNEGVYGLQRAFKIAGAKYLIMSLWKVSDQSTRELMTEFYREWLENRLEIPAAFRKAQQTIKNKYPDAPYHWAGFVLME
jgi:CHAT domain-containing protein